MQAQCWQCCLQVVTGESGSDEDRQRDGLLRRATELRGSISRAQDRYGAVMDVLRATEDMARLPRGAQQVRLLQVIQCMRQSTISELLWLKRCVSWSTQDTDLHLHWQHRLGISSNLFIR